MASRLLAPASLFEDLIIIASTTVELFNVFNNLSVSDIAVLRMAFSWPPSLIFFSSFTFSQVRQAIELIFVCNKEQNCLFTPPARRQRWNVLYVSSLWPASLIKWVNSSMDEKSLVCKNESGDGAKDSTRTRETP